MHLHIHKGTTNGTPEGTDLMERVKELSYADGTFLQVSVSMPKHIHVDDPIILWKFN